MVHLERLLDRRATTPQQTNIVIVPGISGNTLAEQTCPHFDPWIREFVASQKTQTVVWLFHHGIDIQSLECWDRFCDAGVELLQQLTDMEGVGNFTEDDSLILVGHKLGSFILKKALLHAHRARHRPKEKGVLEVLDTLILLGDPHLHTDNCSEWMKLILGCLPKSKPLPSKLCCDRSVQCLQTISDKFEKFTLNSSLFQVSGEGQQKTRPRLRLKRQDHLHGCLCSAKIDGRMWSSTADEETVPEGKGTSSACAFNPDSTHYRNLLLIASPDYWNEASIESSEARLALAPAEMHPFPSPDNSQPQMSHLLEDHTTTLNKDMPDASVASPVTAIQGDVIGDKKQSKSNGQNAVSVEEGSATDHKGPEVVLILKEDVTTLEALDAFSFQEQDSIVRERSVSEEIQYSPGASTSTTTDIPKASAVENEEDPYDESIEEVIERELDDGSAISSNSSSTPLSSRRSPFFSTSMPRRDHSFFGRDDILQKITETISPAFPHAEQDIRLVGQRKVVVLHGIAGIGKSACVAEWLYRNPDLFDSVFWMNANDISHIGRSVHDAAAAVGLLPSRNCHDHTISRTRFTQWLESTDSNWLLVFDDADDIGLLEPYIPVGQYGCILITTRQTSSVSISTGSRNCQYIEVSYFPVDTALSFLKIMAPNADDTTNFQDAESIIRMTGSTPLVLRHIASVVNSKKISFQSFANFAKLVMDRVGDQVIAFGDASISPRELCLNAWSTHLSNHGEGMINVLAFLDAYQIEDSILLGACAWDNIPLLNFPIKEDSIHQARKELVEFALCDDGGGQWEHMRCARSVQRSTRASLSADSFQRAFQTASVLLLKTWPSKRKLKRIVLGNWPEFDSLHSHLHSMSRAIFEIGNNQNTSILDLASVEYMRLLVYFTWYNSLRGNQKEDVQLVELGHALQAMSTRRANVDSRALSYREMPSRLLEIDGDVCKLVQTGGHDEDLEYVALSYYWGTAETELPGLRKDNESKFHEGISLSRLPWAVQDAVNVASAAGIKYLWVDRFCVLRDDDEEFYKNINNLPEIYKNSSLTICVDTNLESAIINNSRQLSRRFEPPSVSCGPWKVYGKPESRRFAPTKSIFVDKLSSAVYWTRAWVVQEGLLNGRASVAEPDIESDLELISLPRKLFDNLVVAILDHEKIEQHGVDEVADPASTVASQTLSDDLPNENNSDMPKRDVLLPSTNEGLKTASSEIEKGTLYFEGGKALEAIGCFVTARNSVAAFKSASTDSLAIYLLASINLGLVYWVEGILETSLEILKSTLKTFKENSTSDNTNAILLGRLYFLFGNVYHSLNLVEEGFGFYQQAKDIFSSSNEGHGDWLAALNVRISDYYATRKEFKEARDILQTAINWFDTQDSVSAQAHLARIFHRQALLYEVEGNARKKRVAFAAAREAWIGVREERGLSIEVPASGLTQKDFDDGVEFWLR